MAVKVSMNIPENVTDVIKPLVLYKCIRLTDRVIHQIFKCRVSLDKLYENHLLERLPANQHVTCPTWKDKVKTVKNLKNKNMNSHG